MPIFKTERCRHRNLLKLLGSGNLLFRQQTQLLFSNLTKEERQAIYSLRDDTSIIIKEADKGSGIVPQEKENYLAETSTQLQGKDVQQELKGNIAGLLEKIIKSSLRKVRNRHK